MSICILQSMYKLLTFLFLLFETGSHLPQVHLKLVYNPEGPLAPDSVTTASQVKCWDYRPVKSHLICKSLPGLVISSRYWLALEIWQKLSKLINLILYLLYIPTTVYFPSSLSVPSPISHLHPSLPKLLLLHSERGGPPLGVNKTWHIKMRGYQAPLSVSRLDEASCNGEYIPKSQLIHTPDPDPTARGRTNRPSHRTVT